jgi:NAD-specific glutamate dehydrogenase
MFMINIRQSEEPTIDAKKLEAMLQEAGQTWRRAALRALTEAHEDESRITRMTLKYGDAFP